MWSVSVRLACDLTTMSTRLLQVVFCDSPFHSTPRISNRCISISGHKYIDTVMPRPKAPKLVRTVPSLQLPDSFPKRAPKNVPTATSPASSGRVTNSTDDSDGLVVSKSKARGGRGQNATEKEYTMSGAIPIEEISSLSSESLPSQTAEELLRVVRNADLVEHAPYNQRTQSKRQKHMGGQENSSSSKSIQILNDGRGHGQSRLLSLAVSRRGSLMSRGHPTPQANPSRPGTAVFEKRPRQPSLLQVVNTDITSSDVEDSTGDFDDFRPDDESTPLVKSFSKRPAANTTLTHSVPKSRKRKLGSPEIQVPATQSQESTRTPLHLPRSDKGSETRFSVHSPGGDPSEHQSPVDNTVHNSRPDSPQQPSPRNQASPSPSSQILSDTFAPPRSSSNSPTPDDRGGVDENLKTSKPKPLSTGRKSKPQHPHVNSNGTSNTSHMRKTRSATEVQPLMTATLQNLMPRRRPQPQAHKATYDILSSSDRDLSSESQAVENIYENDENSDELSFQPESRTKPRKPSMLKLQERQSQSSKAKGQGPKSKKSEASHGKSKSRSKSSMLAKPVGDVATASASTNKRVSRTYFRKSDPALQQEDSETAVFSADDEEDNDKSPQARTKTKDPAATAVTTLNDKAQAEMQRLAEKFRQVDDFTLEFEDMTGHSGSSQMADAR